MEDDGYLYEKAIAAWKCTNQPHPVCGGHNKLAKMRVVKDMMKESYGRPFFVCSERNSPCTFWQWGDVQPLTRLMCRQGFSCAILTVKKTAPTRVVCFLAAQMERKTCAVISNGLRRKKRDQYSRSTHSYPNRGNTKPKSKRTILRTALTI